MPLPFFYEMNVNPEPGTFILSQASSRHCAQVLRMRSGDQLQLTDGKGNLYLAELTNADKNSTGVKIISQNSAPAKREICIGISLLKNTNRLEWFLEKVIEIGATRVIPLICSRTEKQHFRSDRMQSIVISAMLQSQQYWLPVLNEPIEFGNVLKDPTTLPAQRFIAHCMQNEEKITIPSTAGSAIILIGPEGDFTQEEIDAALIREFKPVTLGKTRLRTETAGIVAATLLCARQ